MKPPSSSLGHCAECGAKARMGRLEKNRTFTRSEAGAPVAVADMGTFNHDASKIGWDVKIGWEGGLRGLPRCTNATPQTWGASRAPPLQTLWVWWMLQYRYPFSFPLSHCPQKVHTGVAKNAGNGGGYGYVWPRGDPQRVAQYTWGTASDNWACVGPLDCPSRLRPRAVVPGLVRQWQNPSGGSACGTRMACCGRRHPGLETRGVVSAWHAAPGGRTIVSLLDR